MGLYSLPPYIQKAILTGKRLESIKPVNDMRKVEIPEDWNLQQEALLLDFDA